MKTRVGIIFGGNSVEHEISILSVIQANYAINTDKYDVVNIYMTKDGHFWVGPEFNSLETFKKNYFKHYEVTFYNKKNKLMLKGIKPLFPKKYHQPIDVILPIVHGKNVEDGSLAGYFNVLNIAYASSDILAAAIFQNKYVSKKIFQDLEIKIVDYVYFTYHNYKNNLFKVLEDCFVLGYPMIIKPVSLGSSIGIKIAKNYDELLEAINYAFKYDNEIVVEKKLTSYREFNQALLKTDNGYRLSSIEEVINADTFLTFDDKYLDTPTKKEIPANVDEDLENQIKNYSLKIANFFHPGGVLRIDYLYDEDNKILYLNEVNSIPGSLSYYLFEDNLSFTDLIDQLITQAIKEHYLKNLKLNSFKSNVLSTTKIIKK